MTEGSVLKRRSRHRAADCFHYMSTYRRELLASPACPPTAGNDGGIRSEESEQTQGSRLLHHVKGVAGDQQLRDLGAERLRHVLQHTEGEGSLGLILSILQEEPTLLYRPVLIPYASSITILSPVLRIRIRDGLKIKIRIRDPESLETFIWVKNT